MFFAFGEKNPNPKYGSAGRSGCLLGLEWHGKETCPVSAPCLDWNTDIEDKNRKEKRDLGEMWVKYERLLFFIFLLM